MVFFPPFLPFLRSTNFRDQQTSCVNLNVISRSCSHHFRHIIMDHILRHREWSWWNISHFPSIIKIKLDILPDLPAFWVESQLLDVTCQVTATIWHPQVSGQCPTRATDAETRDSWRRGEGDLGEGDLGEGDRRIQGEFHKRKSCKVTSCVNFCRKKRILKIPQKNILIANMRFHLSTKITITIGGYVQLGICKPWLMNHLWNQKL